MGVAQLQKGMDCSETKVDTRSNASLEACRGIAVCGTKLWRWFQGQRAIVSDIGVSSCNLAGGNASSRSRRPLYSLPASRRPGDDAAIAEKLLGDLSRQLRELEAALATDDQAQSESMPTTKASSDCKVVCKK